MFLRGHFFAKIIQPNRTPRARVSNVGIHIQLNPPFIQPCPILYPPIPPCPIILQPSIEPVIAPPPKNRKSTMTTTSAMISGVLLDSFITLVSYFNSRTGDGWILHLLHFHLLLHRHLLTCFAVHLR